MAISRREAEALVLAFTKKKNIDYKRPEGTPAVWQDRDPWGNYYGNYMTIDLRMGMYVVAFPPYLEAQMDYSECRFESVQLAGLSVADKDYDVDVKDIRILGDTLHIELEGDSHLTIPLKEEFEAYRTYYCDECGERRCTLVCRFEPSNDQECKWGRAPKKVWKFAHFGPISEEDHS